MTRKTQLTGVLTAALAALVYVSSANASYIWTGGAGAGSNWYDTGNWAAGLVPNDNDANNPTDGRYAVGSEHAGMIVTWDSETAAHMPTAVLSNNKDWFSSGWHLSPATYVANGAINYGATNAEFWGDGTAAIDLEVGDGDLNTTATVNMGWSRINRFLKNAGNGLVIKVNADGTVNQTVNLTYRDAQTWVTTINLNGGKWVVDGNVTFLSTGNNASTRTVSFDALGAAFTADFGGDFADLAAVTAQFGDSFVDTTGNGLVATDNQDGSFTVAVVIPEPASMALIGLGGLLMIHRRK
jgi:hypothetical protein